MVGSGRVSDRIAPTSTLKTGHNESEYVRMKDFTVEDLKTAPQGALIKYQCKMDDVVWYAPLEQVLKGAPLHPEDPSGSHWCPHCEDPA